jgi:pimeloyl-ACP methyl ester carboxylesterase
VRLPARGGSLAVLDFGPATRAPDVVFCHANGFNALTYRSILAPLADELRVLALDLRGHGATTLPTDGAGWPGWNGFRDDLLAFLEAEIREPVVLAGHSVGGATSLLAAAAAPERARGLVMLDPVLLPTGTLPRPDLDFPPAAAALRRRRTYPDRRAAFEAYAGRGAFKTWSDEQLRDYVTAGFHDLPGGEVTLACAPEWEALTFGYQNIDPAGAVAALRTPTIALFGEIESTGHFAPPGLAAHPLARVETLPGTTHFLPMERPGAVRAAILAAADR